MQRWMRVIGLAALIGGVAANAQTPPPASSPALQPPPQTPLTDDPLVAPPPPVVAPASQPAAPPPAAVGADAPQARPQQPGLSVAEILARVKELIDQGNFQDALLGITTVLRAEPENFDAKLLLAKLHETRRDYMNARTVYLELAKLQPNNFDVNLGLGRIFVYIQYWRQAPNYLNAADRVARPDQKAEVKILLAMAYSGSGDLGPALKAAEEAVAAEPENYDALAVLVDVRLSMEDYDRAAADGRRLVEAATRDVEAKRGDVERLTRLSHAYQALINILRQHYTTLYVRDAAGAFTDQLLPGRERDAAAFLQQIVDVMVRQEEVRHRMAYHDALVLAAKSSTLDPENPTVLENEALLLLNTDQTEEAVSKFRRILEIDPSHSRAIRELGKLGAPLTSQPSAATQPGDASVP